MTVENALKQAALVGPVDQPVRPGAGARRTMNDKEREHWKLVAGMHHDALVTMQAALIEWKHGKGAEAALQWLVNALAGPGLLPSADEPWGKDAQRYFDANQSEPLPVCACGTPSHIGWMGKGFCSDEHYNEAKAASLN